MSGAFVDIDLSSLPSPDVIERLDYETVFNEMVAKVKKDMPDFDATLESDPAMKVLQVAAFREVNLRQRVNDAARAVMLAYARKGDLDHLVADFGVKRQVIDAGDPDAYPPVLPTYEKDDSLRRRRQLAPEALTVAGSEGAYKFHALGVAGVKDVSVDTPDPGKVVVTVLALDGQGVPNSDLLAAVLAILDARTIRPLTDQVTVEAAGIVEYTIEALLYIDSGPDESVVLDAAVEAAIALVKDNHRLGRGVSVSATHSALHPKGVERVKLTSFSDDISVAANQAAFCNLIHLKNAAKTEQKVELTYEQLKLLAEGKTTYAELKRQLAGGA